MSGYSTLVGTTLIQTEDGSRLRVWQSSTPCKTIWIMRTYSYYILGVCINIYYLMIVAALLELLSLLSMHVEYLLETRLTHTVIGEHETLLVRLNARKDS
jgi:hypothetical protein